MDVVSVPTRHDDGSCLGTQCQHEHDTKNRVAHLDTTNLGLFVRLWQTRHWIPIKCPLAAQHRPGHEIPRTRHINTPTPSPARPPPRPFTSRRLCPPPRYLPLSRCTTWSGTAAVARDWAALAVRRHRRDQPRVGQAPPLLGCATGRSLPCAAAVGCGREAGERCHR
jgi:hypothetical protein